MSELMMAVPRAAYESIRKGLEAGGEQREAISQHPEFPGVAVRTLELGASCSSPSRAMSPTSR